MLIQHDMDEYETVSTSHTCPFHERSPGKPYAGCTCGVTYRLRKRSPEAIAKIKAERQRCEEDRILAEAAAIRARRASTR